MLQRFGVRAGDLEDMCQEVFVVVHQRLHTCDPSAKMTAWLYGICMRVASTHRRRAYRRYEHPDDATDAVAPASEGPERRAMAHQAQARLQAMLDEVELERRAVFVMFEVDEMSCAEIAEVVGIPIGTVHSRLYAARRDLTQVVARWRARESRGGTR